MLQGNLVFDPNCLPTFSFPPLVIPRPTRPVSSMVVNSENRSKLQSKTTKWDLIAQRFRFVPSVQLVALFHMAASILFCCMKVPPGTRGHNPSRSQPPVGHNRPYGRSVRTVRTDGPYGRAARTVRTERTRLNMCYVLLIKTKQNAINSLKRTFYPA